MWVSAWILQTRKKLRRFWSPGSLVLLFGTCWIAQYRCWVPGEGQVYKERVYQEKVWSHSFVYIKIQSEANLALISETYGLLNSRQSSGSKHLERFLLTIEGHIWLICSTIWHQLLLTNQNNHAFNFELILHIFMWVCSCVQSM